MGIFDRNKNNPRPGDHPSGRKRRYVLEIDVAGDEKTDDLILLYQDADLIFNSDRGKKRADKNELL